MAKQCLEQKYSGERRLVALYLDELDDFKPIRDNHVKALEKFADLLDMAVVNLQQAQMNSELGSGVLYIKLQRKLSKNLLTNYYKWVIDNKRKESVLTLREFVLREAEFLSVASETIHGIATKKPKKVVDRQRTFYGQNQKETLSPRCLLCYKNHMLLKCPEFQRMNIQDRWKSIKRLNLCYGCLGKNHVLQNCKKV